MSMLTQKDTKPLPSLDHEQPAILIVDDSSTGAITLRSTLEAAGYRIETAQDVTAAWEFLHEHNPDLVLLDSDLPDAASLCEQIRQEEALGFLPVIMVTSEAERLYATSTTAAPDDYLLRPVKSNQLLMRVRALLNIKGRFDRLIETNRALADDLARQNQRLETALKATEALEALRTDLVRNVGHELRTPLLQVKSAIALLAEDMRPDNLNGHTSLINMATQATGRLEDTVGDITQLAESQNLKQEPFDLNECVDLAIRTLERRWSSQDECGRIVKCYDDTLPLALGDKRGVAQVLHRLLDNALKFTPEGGPVEVLITADEDEQVRVRVRDSGIGIAEDQLERIFEAFYQVESSSTRRFGGSGVGLTLARLILNKLGSTIEVESELGKGSMFSFTLPIVRLEDEPDSGDCPAQASDL